MSKTELIYTTYIKTTPKKLWEAITNPEFARQYWGGMVNVSDWKQGSKWEHQDTNNHNEVKLVGEVKEIKPHTRLVLSWSAPDNIENASQVSYDIIALENGVVRLDVIHSDLEIGSHMHGGVSKGWPLVLSNMKTYLESGNTMDIMAILKAGCGTENTQAA
ncbi:MAG: SRPBCC family protein [Rickettsiales bacterium]